MYAYFGYRHWLYNLFFCSFLCFSFFLGGGGGGVVWGTSKVPKCSGNQKLLARLKYVCLKKVFKFFVQINSNYFKFSKYLV